MTKPPRRVVALIRLLVARPRVLPEPSRAMDGCLRFPGGYCPMGLIPGARNTDPTCSTDFEDDHGLSTDEIQRFAGWWDERVKPRAAVDAVWGKKTTA